MLPFDAVLGWDEDLIYVSQFDELIIISIKLLLIDNNIPNISQGRNRNFDKTMIDLHFAELIEDFDRRNFL